MWDAIIDDPVERERMKLLSQLMMRLEDHIKSKGWSQKEAAKHLGVTQPRVSDLMRGKISVFSIDSLFALMTAAGLKMKVSFKAAASNSR